MTEIKATFEETEEINATFAGNATINPKDYYTKTQINEMLAIYATQAWVENIINSLDAQGVEY